MGNSLPTMGHLGTIGTSQPHLSRLLALARVTSSGRCTTWSPRDSDCSTAHPSDRTGRRAWAGRHHRRHRRLLSWRPPPPPLGFGAAQRPTPAGALNPAACPTGCSRVMTRIKYAGTLSQDHAPAISRVQPALCSVAIRPPAEYLPPAAGPIRVTAR